MLLMNYLPACLFVYRAYFSTTQTKNRPSLGFLLFVDPKMFLFFFSAGGRHFSCVNINYFASEEYELDERDASLSIPCKKCLLYSVPNFFF